MKMTRFVINKKLNLAVLLLMVVYLPFCAGRTVLSKDNPVEGTSAKIYTSEGRIYEGLLLRVDDKSISLIDSETNKIRKVDRRKISRLMESEKEFDFEGKVIAEEQVSGARGYSRTLGYGFGGAALGGLTGFGLGILLAAGASVPFFYPMTACVFGGAYYFGDKGNQRDREAAVDEIRSQRLQLQKQKLQKQVKEAQQRLEMEKKKIQKKKTNQKN